MTAAAAGQEQLFLAAVAAIERHGARQAGRRPSGSPSSPSTTPAATRPNRGHWSRLWSRPSPKWPAPSSRGLARGWPRDRKAELTPELEQTLATLFDKLPPAAKGASRRARHALGQQEARPADRRDGRQAACETASKSDSADDDRVAAATQFVELQKSDAAAAKLLDLITPRSSPELAGGLVEALGQSESPADRRRAGRAAAQAHARRRGRPPSACSSAAPTGPSRCWTRIEQRQGAARRPVARSEAGPGRPSRPADRRPRPPPARSRRRPAQSRPAEGARRAAAADASKRATRPPARSSSRTSAPSATCTPAKGPRSAPT